MRGRMPMLLMVAYVTKDDQKGEQINEVKDVIHEINITSVLADVDNIIFYSKPFKVTYI